MANIWISPTGNDTTGTGAEGTPYLTLSKANTEATDGDTIMCKDGTYSHTSVVALINGSITIKSENVHGAIFDGEDNTNVFVSWAGTSGKTLTIEGIRLTDFGLTDQATISVQNMNSLASVYSRRCWFKNCMSANIPGSNPYSGVIGSSSSSFGGLVHEFVGNIFEDIITPSGNASVIMGARVTTLNVYGNTFVQNTASAGILANRWIWVPDQAGTTGNVKNNIFYNTTGTMTFTGPGSGTLNASNNCNYNTTALAGDTDSITSDPLFVDIANSNFRLRRTSPCIDAGIVL